MPMKLWLAVFALFTATSAAIYFLPTSPGLDWRTAAVAVNAFCIGIFFAGALPIWIRRESTATSDREPV